MTAPAAVSPSASQLAASRLAGSNTMLPAFSAALRLLFTHCTKVVKRGTSLVVVSQMKLITGGADEQAGMVTVKSAVDELAGHLGEKARGALYERHRAPPERSSGIKWPICSNAASQKSCPSSGRTHASLLVTGVIGPKKVFSVQHGAHGRP
jgi:hypothetical protein